MITSNQTILSISEAFPEAIPEFEKAGMGKFFSPEILSKTGRFIRLGTLLRASGIEEDDFVERLNAVIGKKDNSLKVTENNVPFLAMLPCGLRKPFRELLEKEFEENPEKYEGVDYLNAGNADPGLSNYPLLEHVESVDELPDIILASDVNNFFHQPFVDKFIKSGEFQAFDGFEPAPYLHDIGFFDPNQHFTMFTANMLVMAVDKQKLGDREVPSGWDDLLSEDLENDIIMRGDDDFFCNAVFLPFYKEYGFEAIEKLARNIKSGKHPAQMVKLAGSGKTEGASVYIMPYFFAKTIHHEDVEIVWPRDGAIASPVFMLVRKDKMEKHQALLDFLVSEKTGNLLKGRFFPSVNAAVSQSFPEPVKWLGWDFLLNQDIGQLKRDIRTHFTEARQP